MEPYVTDEAEEEVRPDANASKQATSVSEQPSPEQLPSEQIQPSLPVPRRGPTLPVRFASPVTGRGDGSTSRRRPFRRTSRDQSPPDRKAPGERAGRGDSPFLGEPGRQASSPSPIREFPSKETRRGREVPATGPRERSPPPLVDTPRDNRASRATNPDTRGSHYSEEDPVYLPSYFRRSGEPDEAARSGYYDEEYDLDLQDRREQAAHPSSPYVEPQDAPSARWVPPRRTSGYYDDEEVDVRIQNGRAEIGRWPRARFESPHRPYPTQPRGAGEYDSEEELAIRVRRGRERPVVERESRYRPLPHRVSTRANYYDEDADLRPTRRAVAAYVTPRTNPYDRYPPPPRRRSTTYDDEDEIDTRLERRRSPSPVKYPRQPYPPDISYKSNYLEQEPAGTGRARTSPPPLAAAPVIINGRIYRDYDDEPAQAERQENGVLNLVGPSAHSRSRSRVQSRSKAPSVAPVIINNRIQDDYEKEDYNASRLGKWDEPDLGFVPIPEAYPFSLSRHSKSLRGTESIMSSASDVSELSEKNEANVKPQPKGNSESGRTYHVLRSQYIGDGVIGGSHAVQLSLIPEPVPNSTKGVAAVFRWVHFEDKNMDIDNFEHNALNIPGLTDFETAAIAKTLARAKKGYDKPLQTSTKVKTRFMVPSFLQDTLSREKRPSASNPRTISWMCAPYFCLEKYSTPSGLRASSHPMRTLLQARFALVQKERDMKQAVCYLQNIPPEHCFHIAQVWLLILDDSLVVSCARLPMNSLQGDFISTLPKAEVQPSLRSPSILVSTKSSLLWTLPLEECQSWFAFVSHFWDYWPLQVEVTLNEKPITSSDWPRITKLAQKTNVRLVVDFRAPKKTEPVKGFLLFEDRSAKDVEDISSAPGAGDHLTRGPSLRPIDHKKPNNTSKKPGDQFKEEFHVFTWLNCRNGSQSASLDSSAVNVNELLSGFESQGLEDDLTEIHNYLTKETSLNHRLIYNRCPEINNRAPVYNRLSELKPDALSVEKHVIAHYETLVGIVNAAELLYRFFLPIDYHAPTISKYWGAFFKLFLSMPQVKRLKHGAISNRHTKSHREASEVLDWLIQINNSTVPFKDYLSHAAFADRQNIAIPEELTTAWLHLVLALTASIEDMPLFDIQMAICHELIEQGIEKVISNTSKVELSTYAVFPPFELASLIAFQLSRDENDSAADISDTYLEYLKTLQSDIEGNPLDRSHQDRIVCLKQEIEVISETLDVQQYVFRQAQRGFGASRIGAREDAEYVDAGFSRRPSPRTGGHIQPADSAGVQSLIIQDSLALVENRIRGFREMREIASELGDWNIQKIDSNKDRQEAAIYAFTIVTIIFLPLGTVAGIMGMNTSDVRDMPFGQWVYWATALPLTILVIALCLAWAGELNNFRESFANLWRRNPRGYKMIRERYEGAGRRKRYDEVALKRPRRSNALYGGKESYV